MGWLRGLIFGNWRNRGVALFFALIIWFVSFQTEKQTWNDEVRVTFRPQDRDSYVITETQLSQVSGTSERAFDGGVSITLEGPRKQIEEWKTRYRVQRKSFFIDVPPQTKEHLFQEEDFDLPEGLAVTEIVPESVYIQQDEWGTRTFSNLSSQNLLVNFTRQFHQIKTKVVDPNEVTVTGPVAILDAIEVDLSVRMGYNEEFDAEEKIGLRFTDPNISQRARQKVEIDPETVSVRVELQPSTEKLSVDAVRVTFRVPPGLPMEIQVPEDRIPLLFEGPQDEIVRLRELLAQDASSVTVSVKVERRVTPEVPNTFTEADLDLELDGFDGIKIRQHERTEGPFSFTVVPCKVEGDE